MDTQERHLNEFGKSEFRPLVPGSLRGYRAWYVNPDDGYGLRSTRPGFNYIWQPQRNTAECMTINDLLTIVTSGCICGSASCAVLAAKKLAQLDNVNHRSPSPPQADADYCAKCGFYAFHNPFPTKTQFSNYLPFADPDLFVMGSIKATGFIVVGEVGFRAEYAEVEAVSGENARTAAMHYGVPWFPTMHELQEQLAPAPEFAKAEA